MCFDSQLLQTIRHAYLSSYQILSTEDHQKDFSDPKAWGAGFIIEYKGYKYLVSALHVIDPKNYPDFTNWKPDPKVGILSGYNDEALHQQLCVPTSGFYEYINLPKPLSEDDLVFPQPVDLAYAHDNSLEKKCISLGFKFGIVRIESQLSKEYFLEGELNVSPSSDERFFIVGSIYGKNNPLEGKLTHHLHRGLKLIGSDETYYTMESQSTINQIEEWSGLSGSAVVSEGGKVIGMLTNASDNSNLITVMKLERILSFINQSTRLTAQGIDMHQPSIIVGPGMTLDDIANNPAFQQIAESLKESSEENQ